jgi:gamma-polyglutamate biosynthesis protein CapA
MSAANAFSLSAKPRIQLIAVGDICPGDHNCMGFGTRTLMKSHGPLFPLQHVAHMLREGNIVFGNCEGVLSNVGADDRNIDTLEFRGLPEFATALHDSGFTILTVANNHAGEHGREALIDTINNLRSAGVKVIGLRDKKCTAVPLIQEINGIRIGWLAYTWIVSKNTSQDRGLLSWTRGHEVPAEIAALRPNVDFLIVSAHWGREIIRVPPRNVIDAAHGMAEAGADLVLGHHPHLLQGIEQHGKCVIVYSLGDFVFDDWLPWFRERAIFRCTIEAGNVSNPEFIPLMSNRQFQVVPATKAQRTRILRKIDKSTRAIIDPRLARLRDESRARRLEARRKRLFGGARILFLIANIGRMGPRIAYQKLCRRLPLRSRKLTGGALGSIEGDSKK